MHIVQRNAKDMGIACRMGINIFSSESVTSLYLYMYIQNLPIFSRRYPTLIRVIGAAKANPQHIDMSRETLSEN